MEIGNSKIVHQPKNEKDKIKILENKNKELQLELESKNNEIQRLLNELDKKKCFSCEYVFHTYAVYKGTDNIAICQCRKDYTSLLSDELILIIFHYLPQNFLHTCAKVCKRWRKIYHNKSLWREINIIKQGICICEINYLITLGAKKLVLSHVEVYPLEGEIVEENEDGLSEKSHPSKDRQHKHDNHNELQKLRLRLITIDNYILSKLIRKSSELTSLTIDCIDINTKVCKAISQLIKLISLKLLSLQLYSNDLKCILQGCTHLTKLDLTGSQDWLSEPPSYFPSQLTKLVLAEVFYRKRSNELIFFQEFEEIIKRCPNIVSLNIDHCSGLTQISISHISKYLQKLQYLSLQGNDRLNYSLSVLKNIPTLQEIRLSCKKGDMDPTLKDNLKNIKLIINYLDNAFGHRYIAC